MAIFQKSVIKNALDKFDKEQLDTAYNSFKNNFTFEKIERIKKLNEEKYQDGFLRDLFVDVFGYVLEPDQNSNLAREFIDQSGGKADGAILNENGNAIAVIELKSTTTKDLKVVTKQAFNYKNNQPDCKYVITSNFQKLRFYVDTATEFEEFDLFNLNKSDFDLLFLILCKNSIFSDVPLKLKTETELFEKEISDKLYDDYSKFKNKIYENLIKNNLEFDKLTLFKTSQKILDRFLFILFAEDCGLLPPNIISQIIDRYKTLKKADAYKPIYTICKQYFGYIDVGKKDENIPEYNGGLFAPDKLLDNLKIDDSVLIDDLLILSEYDFCTEVDVNILGHIFEHSLTEIEEITAEIEGVSVDKTKNKRKKEGVFYTPPYITKYIVENTIGKLCEEKRLELGIQEIEIDDSYKNKNGTLNAEGNKLEKILKIYKNWLLKLKILDPACGSGAFLNQALNFLIEEHKIIDDIINDLTNMPLGIFDTDVKILENNLYGVDINEESVEIAKLSLWLRTAQKGRKLSNLNNNIKCGNSLIDDPEIAGEKAFDWQKEFPKIMANGGFDVVIGNPPYVKVQNLKHKEIDWFKKNKKVAYKRIDISLMFFELAKSLLNPKGLLSFITSNQFIVAEYGKNTREFLLNNFSFKTIIDFGDLPIFQDALTYVSIFTLQNNKPSNFDYLKINNIETAKSLKYKDFINIDISTLTNSSWTLLSKNELKLIDKINSHKPLNSFAKCSYGIITGSDNLFILEQKEIEEYNIEKEILLPLIRAENCYRYGYSDFSKHVIYPYKYEKDETILLSINEIQKNYKNLYNYLYKNKDKLTKRKDSRKTFENSESWYSLTRFGQLNIFKKNKIVFPGETKNNKFGIDLNKAGYSGARVFAISIEGNETSIKYLLSILNSKLLEYYLHSKTALKQGGYHSYSSTIINEVPIPQNRNQQPFIERTDKM